MTSSSKNTRGEIFTLLATAIVILIGVTTFVTTTFLNKKEKKLTYQSKAIEGCYCSGSCQWTGPLCGDEGLFGQCCDQEPPAEQPTSAPEPLPTQSNNTENYCDLYPRDEVVCGSQERTQPPKSELQSCIESCNGDPSCESDCDFRNSIKPTPDTYNYILTPTPTPQP